MAVTFKQLLNRALRITGEAEIASTTTEVSDTNHLLIAEMASQIKEEVEAAQGIEKPEVLVCVQVVADVVRADLAPVAVALTVKFHVSRMECLYEI